MKKSTDNALDFAGLGSCWGAGSVPAGQRFHGENQTKTSGKINAQKFGARNPVRVNIANPSRKGEFPVYLTSLGTVQAFNTVQQYRSRVDGQIDKIGFTGRPVRQAGRPLNQDPTPGPTRRRSNKRKAKKEQDEANLANINLDLQRFIKLGEFATRQQLDTQRSNVSQLTAQIAADKAAIDNAQTQLDYTDIKAPFSGVVGLRRSTSATSSTPRPRPGSSRSPRLSRSR